LRRGRAVVVHALFCAFTVLAVALPATISYAQTGRTGRQVYETACAACHGVNGRGAPALASAYPLPAPDFTDCAFATREPDSDWLAVSHRGGPARAFDRLMPAFGDALTREELERAVEHVRTFCTDDRWPRGELNLPRALVTTKAYPEDEAVMTVIADSGAVTSKFVYERRIGARSQVEVIAPLAFSERGDGDWTGGVGDLAFAFKRTLHHNHVRGRILSAALEVVTPTGSTERGIGGGTTVLEPFVAYGQVLPNDVFLQFQSGAGIPFDRDHDDEVFWRGVFGRTLAGGPWGFGRSWSPMLEVLGSRELRAGAAVHWDVVPQMQVTLSRRQHVRLNGGVRIPMNERQGRTTQVLVYLLWDWFDGGLKSGW
jgi:mono/diheme cytochrome c family protein